MSEVLNFILVHSWFCIIDSCVFDFNSIKTDRNNFTLASRALAQSDGDLIT